MRKKMVAIVIAGIVIVVGIFFAGWYFMFCHLGIGPAFPFLPVKNVEIRMESIGILAEDQLMTTIGTQEEAEYLASQYGIELVSFADGVATYKTDEDPNEVIARGEENGYLPLYLNYIRNSN
ncbi:MAG: hypothetical protein NC419_12755 [Muribaculaceae bacterium]|nr:hypothetical protein [Muribaculaceae bacterium]